MPKRSGFFGAPVAEAARAAREDDVAALILPRTRARQDIPVERLRPNPFQPRKDFSGVEELAATISELGFQGSLQVRPAPGQPGTFELVFGERRLRAARIVGLERLPCEIADFTDEEMIEIGLAENIQRRDLTPLEEAEAFHMLVEERGYSVRKLAAKIGKDKGYVEIRLALVQAPTDVRELVEQRPDSLRAAREIAAVPEPEQRAPLIAGVRSGALTTRDVTTLAREARQPQPAPAAPSAHAPAPARPLPPALQDRPPVEISRNVVQIRLSAADEDALREACRRQKVMLGRDVEFDVHRAPGHKGDWLAYGTWRLEGDDD